MDNKTPNDKYIINFIINEIFDYLGKLKKNMEESPDRFCQLSRLQTMQTLLESYDTTDEHRNLKVNLLWHLVNLVLYKDKNEMYNTIDVLEFGINQTNLNKK